MLHAKRLCCVFNGDQFFEVLKSPLTFLEFQMEKISESRICEILQPLNIPNQLIKVTGSVIQVQGGGADLQLQRVRLALIQAGRDSTVDPTTNTVTVGSCHPLPELVKFMKSARPGSDSFEGLAFFNAERARSSGKPVQRVV